MQTKPRNLLICANCFTQGTKSVLGELTSDGAFVVMRFHNGYSKIIAENYTVVCGACDSINMRRGTYAE